MPVYEYECRSCGGFTAWGAMASSGQPAPCPGCGADASRVLSATAMLASCGRRPSPGAEPRLVQRSFDPPLAASPKTHHPHAGRPWMMGH